MNGKEILQSISNISTDHEFYTPIPEGYKVGKTKFILVFGTVMSGLGKGIFSASIGKLLQDKGFNVAPIKLEGYLNVDSGTLNPYRHGEVFVLDDGIETDMDLGTYERMLNKNLTKRSFTTSGQIYSSVFEKERRGVYLGRDVQIIPHVTGEIKLTLRKLAMEQKADVICVEVGGTVGDLENMHYLEALRELAYEEGKENVCIVALTYILTPSILGEQKSKAAQLGIKKLMEEGIQPDLVACRCPEKVTDTVREKISIYTNVPLDRVISMHDIKSVYLVPELLKDAGIDEEIIDVFGLKRRADENKAKKEWKLWQKFTDGILKPKKTVTIGITGKYTSLRDSYASVMAALEHACSAHNVKLEMKWIETTKIERGTLSIEEAMKGIDGVIVPGGFGKRGVEGKIACVKYLRENNIPYLGLCLGFQMAVIDFARHVCNLKGANSTEVERKPVHPVIDNLPEQKKIEGLGGNMRLGGKDVEIKKGTLAYKLYGNKTLVRERFRHRWEVNPEYIPILEKKGMVFSGKAPKFPIMQILELPDHKFFVGSQFHPEFTSKPLSPNPLYMGFIKAIVGK